MQNLASRGGQKKKVLILGGGFGGIETALRLDAINHKGDLSITLVSDKYHFEYTPGLYRVVTGKSPLEVCIQLSDIFEHTDVMVDVDTISKIDIEQNIVLSTSGTTYKFDFLVVALGSEPAYFGIPGLDQYSLGFKSISQALALKRHLHNLFDEHSKLPKNEIEQALHIDVVGAGPAGVELAGELSVYLKTLAKNHDIDPQGIKIDLIEAAPRVLPTMPEKVSNLALEKLKEHGVNVMLNTKVMSHDGQNITYSDGVLPSKTLIWTAGVKPHHIYSETVGFEKGKTGRVVVDEYLRVKSKENIFIIGDGADTPFSGTAQTALHDGISVAETIGKIVRYGKPHLTYTPARSAYVVPVGPGWGIFTYKNLIFSGRIVWWIREIIEFDFFLSILPFRKAWRAWRDGYKNCESCPTCEAELKKS